MENETNQNSMIPMVNLWQTVIVGVVSLIVTLVSVGIYTGGLSQRITTLEESKNRIEQKLDSIEAKMAEKEDLREIKDDLKELRKVSRK